MSDRHYSTCDGGEPTPSLRSGNGSAELRLEKFKQAHMLRVAANHNKRTGWRPRPNPQALDAGAQENECLWGPTDPSEITKLAAKLRADAGVVKVRKNQVHIIEIVVSARPRACADDRAFFVAALDWIAENFGGLPNVLSADIHRDEASPHMHVLILPLVDGKMRGSDMVKAVGKLRALRSDFEEHVCRRHGLAMPVGVLRGESKARASETVLRALADQRDAVADSSIWWAVKESINRDPRPFLHALDIDVAPFLPSRKLRTSTAIFTSKGKGPST